jgi:hypothetical protein
VIEKVLQNHLARYPDLKIWDLYKLLHQAALGSEHAVPDPASAERWLVRELTEMDQGIPEPLIDPISHNGEIVRVHLRPYVAAGHDPQGLLDAFIRTANGHRGDAHLLERYWADAVALVVFPAHQMKQFFHELEAKGFPAVHHSPEYEKLYHPAYRVISLALCPEMRL